MFLYKKFSLLRKTGRWLIGLLLVFVLTAQTMLPAVFALPEEGGDATTLSTVCRGTDGKGYRVTASYSADAGIPDDAVLSVRSISGSDGDYAGYVSQAAQTLRCSIDTETAIQLFDIAIVSGDSAVEYQPSEGASIEMKVRLASVPEAEIGVVHFGDETERLDSEVDGRTVSFEATGFSVYAFVSIHGVDSIVHDAAAFDEMPVYLSVTIKGNMTYFISAGTNPGKNNSGPVYNRTEVNSYAGACTCEFEKLEGTDNQYYLKLPDGDGVMKYADLSSPTNARYSATPKTVFTVTPCGGEYTDQFYISFRNGNTTYYLNLRKDNNGSGFNGSTYGPEPQLSVGSNFTAYHSLPTGNDLLGLDGKTYGIARTPVKNMSTVLSSGQKSSSRLAAEALAVRANPLTENQDTLLKVGGDVDLFTFHNCGENEYNITTEVAGTTKYLCLKDGGTFLVDAPDEYCVFTVKAGTGNYDGAVKITCQKNGASLSQDGNAESGFVSKNSDSINEYFYLVEPLEIDTDDYIPYTAVKVSVSDVRNHTKVIVYTRIWNESRKRYEIYAIDHDGSLVYCYDEGETIRWAGTQINTLLWDFTEYYYWLTWIPNHYYELRNVYSGKYIAPQYHTGQILSDRTIGINLPGRRYGEYYSTILAWDDHRYDYAGLKPGDGSVTAVPMAQAQDFYFAVMDNPAPAEFSTVETVDNDDHGIKMRLINFQGEKYGTNNGAGGRDWTQTNVIGEGTDSFTGGKIPVLDLVTTDLKENGYPDSVTTGKSLEELFGGATGVNQLFLKSTYEESGYFEYNCTQNFATLLDSGNFRVYNQLGTVEVNTNSQGHGWFMPFNDIDPSKVSVYTNITDVNNEPLASNNPRLGETLYSIPLQQAYYHFGMEMEASFIQSKDGLDAWGHDIIFEFAGDDDMWLYVDGELVLDLGGVHSALVGKINFRTGEVTLPNSAGKEITTDLRAIFRENYRTRNPMPEGMTEAEYDAQTEAYLDGIFKDDSAVFKDYSSHTMKMFYMERGAGASNLHMRFNLTTAVDGQLLLSKSVSGTDKQDYASARFPYQIWYHDKTSGLEEWKTVRRASSEDGEGNNYAYTGVSSVNYLGKGIPVEYEPSYEGYENVFFLKPGETAEVQFPDDSMEYFIRECHVDNRVYDRVSVNEEEIAGSGSGNFLDYSTEPEVIGERKVVNFDNHVSPDALRTLTITKRLFDEHNNPLIYPEDETGFRFRVYIGEGSDSDGLGYYRMDSYYVKDPEGNYCQFDYAIQKFRSIGKKNFEELTPEDLAVCTFTTSPSGAVDRIPADFTVEIRNLLIDTKFRIEERESDIPKGYDFIRYVRGGDGSYIVEDGDTINSGIVRANQNPQVIVENHRGWGLTVEKVWTDDSFMLSHDNIYFAVYYNDTLIPGTVRRMKTEATAVYDQGIFAGYDFETSLYYYFRELIEGAAFSDYVVREVALTDPVVDENGYVTSYGSITPLVGDVQLINGGIPSQTMTYGEFAYTVSYEVGEPGGPANNVRTDTVTNARPGVRIVKVDGEGEPLPGAVFTLKDGSGNDVSDEAYTSDATGLVTYAYPEQNVTYTLTETAAPDGYSALLNTVTFTMSGDELTVTSDNAAAVSVLPADADGMITIRIRNDRTFFSALKIDEDTELPVEGAHFALYRQVEGKNGPRKDYNPLTGYEDLVSGTDGLIPQIDTALPAGTYYLCETQAPKEYLTLDSDIIFTVGTDGTVTVQAPHTDMLASGFNDDNVLIYTLRVPNRRSFRSVPLDPQTLVADFGLDINYNVKTNNYRAEDAVYSYVGICDAHSYDKYGTEKSPTLLAAAGTPYKGKFGTVTLDADGNAHYRIDTMSFTGEDEFCLVAHVTSIGGKAASVYVYEKLTYIPATTVYYEDDFVADENYHDGVESAPTGYDFGKWSRVTAGDPKTEQAADLAGHADANLFGYDPNYTDFATYSNNASHKVAVSSVNGDFNNTHWPYMEFDFAGTGFDLISVTGCDTGVFTVRVYPITVDENGHETVGTKTAAMTMVDTYYGYEYGRMYVDGDGAPTLTETTTPLYEATQELIAAYQNDTDHVLPPDNLLTAGGKFLTPTVTYYDTDKNITETPHYYDTAGKVTETATYVRKDGTGQAVTVIPEGQNDDYEPNYAYALAEGWLQNLSASDSLYQIPVIKIRNLKYGAYRAVIQARFAPKNGHYYNTMGDYQYYDLYVDAFRIYDPAGIDEEGNIASGIIQDSYNYSNEAFEKFTTLKSVVIGVDTMGSYNEADGRDETVEKDGAVLVDGNVVLDSSRIADYKKFGPNNELYLSKGMSVAFEISASTIPEDVQIQLKKISDAYPTLKITYVTSDNKVFTNEVEVRTATDLSYSIMKLIGKDNIKWKKANGSQNSGLVIVSNVGEDESLISITNLKWTFKAKGGEYSFYYNTSQKVTINSSSVTSLKKALSFTRKSVAAKPEASPQTVCENGAVTMTVVTGTEVTTLLVKDQDGNPIDESLLAVSFQDLDDAQRRWTVTVSGTEDDDYTFLIYPENDGLVSGEPIRIDVSVETELPEETDPEPASEGASEDDDGSQDSRIASWLQPLRSLWLRFTELLKRILAFFGVKFN